MQSYSISNPLREFLYGTTLQSHDRTKPDTSAACLTYIRPF